jgi:hypothetical protein
MTTVTLSRAEVTYAAMAGVLRQVSAIQHKRPAAYGAASENRWSIGIEGTAAEMAVAKYLDTYWEPLAPDGDLTRLHADVGHHVQVRSTLREDGSLILHERDADDQIFYLVICRAPDYDIVGWIPGGEGKRPEWWREDVRHPAWFVPQTELYPCENGNEARIAPAQADLW